MLDRHFQKLLVDLLAELVFTRWKVFPNAHLRLGASIDALRRHFLNALNLRSDVLIGILCLFLGAQFGKVVRIENSKFVAQETFLAPLAQKAPADLTGCRGSSIILIVSQLRSGRNAALDGQSIGNLTSQILIESRRLVLVA